MARLGRSQPQSTRVRRRTPVASGTTYTITLSASTRANATEAGGTLIDDGFNSGTGSLGAAWTVYVDPFGTGGDATYDANNQGYASSVLTAKAAKITSPAYGGQSEITSISPTSWTTSTLNSDGAELRWWSYIGSSDVASFTVSDAAETRLAKTGTFSVIHSDGLVQIVSDRTNPPNTTGYGTSGAHTIGTYSVGTLYQYKVVFNFTNTTYTVWRRTSMAEPWTQLYKTGASTDLPMYKASSYVYTDLKWTCSGQINTNASVWVDEVQYSNSGITDLGVRILRGTSLIRAASTPGSASWSRTVAVDRGGATARGLILTPGSGTYPGTDYPSGILGPTAVVAVDRGGATAGGVQFGNVTQSVTLSASTASSASIVRSTSRTLSAATTSAATRVLSISRLLSASTTASAALTTARTFVSSLSASTSASASILRSAARSLSASTASQASISQALSALRTLSAQNASSAVVAKAVSSTKAAASTGSAAVVRLTSTIQSATATATAALNLRKPLTLNASASASVTKSQTVSATKTATESALASVRRDVSAIKSVTSTASAAVSRLKALLLSLSATSVTSASISGLETETALRGQATASGREVVAVVTADRGAALAREPLANPSDTTYPGVYPGEVAYIGVAVVDRGGATAGGTIPGVTNAQTFSTSSTGTGTVTRTVSKTLAASTATSSTLKRDVSRTLAVTSTSSATIEELESEPILRGGATASGYDASAVVSSGPGSAVAGNPFGYPSDLTYPGVYPGKSQIIVVASVDRGGATASGNAPFVGTALTLTATVTSGITIGRDAARTLAATATAVLAALKAITHELVATTTTDASVLEVEGENISRGAASAAGTDASAVVDVSTGGALAANPFGYPSDATYPGIYPGESTLVVTVTVDRGGATAAGRIPNVSDYVDVAAITEAVAALTAEVFAVVGRGGARAGDPLANPSDTSFPPIHPGQSTLQVVAGVERGGATASGYSPFAGDSDTLTASTSASVTVKKTVFITLTTSVTGSGTVERVKSGPQTADRGGATAYGREVFVFVIPGRGSALAHGGIGRFGYPSPDTYPGLDQYPFNGLRELIDAGSDSWFLAVVSQDSGFEAFDVGSEVELKALDVGSDMSLEAV